MSEIKEITVIILKHLSDALLSAASELSKGKNSDPIIANCFEPLAIGIDVLFDHKKRRIWATIIKIEGDELTVENTPLDKTYTISTSQVILRSDIAYEID
ncbi:MAG: hypothetical protein ACK48D_11000 [Pseudanabaena sp.]